jgi:long-chain acyl-CoA synthetase
MIPVAIDGTYRVLPRGGGLGGLHRVTIRVGGAIVDADDRTADPHARTDTLRTRIASLLQGAGS